MIQFDLRVRSNSKDKNLFNKIIEAIVHIEVDEDEIVEVLWKPDAIKCI